MQNNVVCDITTGLQYKFAIPPYVQLLVPHTDIMCCAVKITYMSTQETISSVHFYKIL